MAKRFTDTTIWKNQKWFKKLNPIYKLAWKYITDLSDHAGIWKIDLGELSDDLGIDEFDLEDFLQNCNVDYDKKNGKKICRDRLLVVRNDYLWITGFIKFQYEGKSKKIDPTSKVANSAIEILNGFGLLHKAIKEKCFFELKINELSPMKPHEAPPNPSKPLQGDKERDKDKGEGIKEQGLGEGLQDGGSGEEKLIVPQMCQLWYENFTSYTSDKEADFDGMGRILKFIYKLTPKPKDVQEVDTQVKILNTLQLIADQVNREPFWVNKPIKSIANNVQEFFNKIKNPINGKQQGNSSYQQQSTTDFRAGVAAAGAERRKKREQAGNQSGN